MNEAILRQLEEINTKLALLIDLFEGGQLSTTTERTEETELEVEGGSGPFISIHVGGLRSDPDEIAKAVATELAKVTAMRMG